MRDPYQVLGVSPSASDDEIKKAHYTRVQELDRQRRREELARLTGGAHVSEVMLSGAEELLLEAEGFKKSLL